MIKDCVKILNIVGANYFAILWVPSHSNVEGNDIADTFARQGSSCHISWAANVSLPLSLGKAYFSSKLTV